MFRTRSADIRPAHSADADAVAALVDRAYAKWVPILGRKPQPMLADYRKAVVEHRVFVIDGDADLAAVIELVPAADHMLIENVAVDPARQGAGLGRMLLVFAQVEALEAGLREMRLYTNALMTSNIALYERFGYAILEHRVIEQLNTTAVYMTKSI
jgi:ribosomal protein S18 acetylase RimI-like enzyme